MVRSHRRWARLTLRGAHAVLGRGEAALGEGEEREARLGEDHRARGAEEELRAELVLELVDALAERGGRERDGAGGGAEVEQACGGGEAAEAVDRGEHDREVAELGREAARGSRR
jgi:hypothetical protein